MPTLLQLKSKIILALLGLAFALQPAFVLAAETTNATSPFGQIDCPALATAEATNQKVQEAATTGFDTIHTVVNGLLKNLLIGKSLHYRLRCSPLITGIDDNGNKTTSAYNVAKNLVNFGVLLILLVIAFANILRIKLDTYAVKKAVPLLLFGVVMANLGLPIIRTIVDFSEVLTATFIHQASPEGTKTGFVKELIGAVYQGGVQEMGTVLNQLSKGGSNGWPAFLGLLGIVGFGFAAFGPFAAIVLIGGAFLIFLPAIMFFVLGLMFVARIYYIVILAAVSPLAFASLGFEPLRGKVWGWWWTHFIKWVFMAPASFALFWLGIVFYHSVGSEMDLGTYVLILFLIYYAIQLPLKMGGSVMTFWNNSVAKPVGAALSKPFAAGRDYVAKAGPRDVSRFLSSPPEWLARRLPGRTLNYGRYTKEAMAQIEAKNAQREATSAAARGGKMAGQFITSFDTIYQAGGAAARGGLNKFSQNYLKTDEGRREVTSIAKELFRGLPDPAKIKSYSQLTPEEQHDFETRLVQHRDSGDRAKVQAAIVANAMYGRDLVSFGDKNDSGSWAFYEDQLNDDMASRGALRQLFDDIYSKKTGLPVAGDADDIARRVASVVTGRDDKRSGDLLSSIRDYMKQSVQQLKTLEQIQRDPKQHGYVKGVIEAADAGNRRAMELMSEFNLERHRDGLGMPSVQVLFGQIPASSPVRFDQTEKNSVVRAFQDEGLTEDAMAKLPRAGQASIMKLWATEIQPEMKNYMGTLIENAVNNSLAGADQGRRNLLARNLTQRLILPGDNVAPEPIDTEGVARLNQEMNLGLRAEEINNLSANLASYRAGANTLQTLKSQRDAAAAAVAQTAQNEEANQASSGNTPTVPH